MSGKQQIEFIIRPDGTVEEKVTGVTGPDCEKATDSIEQALGGEIVKREHTSEYFGASQDVSDNVTTSA